MYKSLLTRQIISQNDVSSMKQNINRLQPPITTEITTQPQTATSIHTADDDPFIIMNNPSSVNDNDDNVLLKQTDNDEEESSSFTWTALTILQSLSLFGLAGVAEIVGGWMVWMAVRGNSDQGKKPWWFALTGSALLVVYGFLPCLQPMDSFGRIYAAYGGFFIVLSFLFGWALDGDRPDLGDVVGGTVSLVGVCLILFWPRG